MPSSSKKRSRSAGLSSGWFRLLLLALAVGVLVFCWRLGARTEYVGVAQIPHSEEEMREHFSYLELQDTDRRADGDDVQKIDLSSETGDLELSGGGDYRLTGSLDGAIRVSAPEQTVHLILAGVDIRASEGPAILVENADRVIITLEAGSDNVIVDSGSPLPDSDYDGCIFSRVDLTFNGTGRLDVTGLYADAIRSKNRVKIVEGEYRIHAKRSGIRGNDGILIAGGSIFIGSEKYGLKTTNTGPDGRGNLMIAGGTLSIVAGRYAFVAEKASLYLYDCSVQTNSVVNDYDVNGPRFVEDGCLT